ncbi:MAG TPA: zf-HC2 domain-containing protein [Candidatus Polarisedimenticolaceae bacterium]|nr:zf-HC2 domain-containing protein [Candidatus Polarisedimenticolaceae bacterium]
MTCREFIGLLDSYLAREVPEDQLRQCEQHLAGCASCTAYLHSYQVTVALGRSACQDLDGPVPADVPEELVQALLALRPKA